MAKKRAKTEVEIAYEKARKRVKQLISRAEKRGYIFPENIIPKKVKKPTLKSIERLKKITASEVYKKAKYVSPETGLIYKGTEGRKKERTASAKKAAQTRKLTAPQTTPPLSGKAIEIKRINQLIEALRNEYIKRGYLFPKGYLEGIQEKANRGNLSLEELQNITLESIFLNKVIDFKDPRTGSLDVVKFKDPRTGTIFSGTEGLKIESHRKDLDKEHKKSDETNAIESDRVLELIREYITTWTPGELWTDWFSQTKEHDKNVLERILNGAIISEGEDAVAERMQAHAAEIIDIVESVLYGSGGKTGRNTVMFDLIRFSSILMGRPLSQPESDELTYLSEGLEVEEVE